VIVLILGKISEEVKGVKGQVHPTGSRIGFKEHGGARKEIRRLRVKVFYESNMEGIEDCANYKGLNLIL